MNRYYRRELYDLINLKLNCAFIKLILCLTLQLGIDWIEIISFELSGAEIVNLNAPFSKSFPYNGDPDIFGATSQVALFLSNLEFLDTLLVTDGHGLGYSTDSIDSSQVTITFSKLSNKGFNSLKGYIVIFGSDEKSGKRGIWMWKKNIFVIY